jgi:hypothetical protein
MHVHHSLARAGASRPPLRRISLVGFVLFLALVSLYFRGVLAERPGGSVAPPPGASAARPAALARYRYVEATGHNLGPRAAAFYDQGGGLPIFGLPLTEEFEEDGVRVQYFERARFELRPDGRVALTPLGTLIAGERQGAAFEPPAAPGEAGYGQALADDRSYGAFGGSGRREPPETALETDPISGHSMGGALGAFWRANRGLELFGRPISEPFEETNPHDDRRYQVQYFERARLEWHPEFAGTGSEVMLGLLGREYADARALDPALRAPAQPIAALGAATLSFSPKAARVQNIVLAANRLDGRVVAPGQELSFLEDIGQITRAAGFMPDDTLVGGELVQEIGGGICYASTAMFRAAYRAGLEIVELHPHSRPLDRRGDSLGFDSAVYSPGLDLRWRNDTPAPIEVAASVDTSEGKVTIALWGIGDGRTAVVRGPSIKNRRTVPDTWGFDAALAEGASRKISEALQGMDVVFSRVVRGADGQVLRKDSFRARYAPRGATYRFGKGVTPPEGAVVE